MAYQRVGARTEDDPGLQELEQSTRPETLVKQIEKATTGILKVAHRCLAEDLDPAANTYFASVRSDN